MCGIAGVLMFDWPACGDVTGTQQQDSEEEREQHERYTPGIITGGLARKNKKTKSKNKNPVQC